MQLERRGPRAMTQVAPGVMIAFALLAACTGSAFNGGTGTPKKDEAPQSKPAPDTGPRPTDEAEGLPGYLTDPEHIELQRLLSSSKLRINGPSGAIANAAAHPERTPVYIWRISRATFVSIVDTLEPEVVAAGQLVATVTPATDGAFEAVIDAGPEPILVVTEPPRDATSVIVRNTDPGKPRVASRDPLTSEPFRARRGLQLTWTREDFEATVAAHLANEQKEDADATDVEKRAYAFCIAKVIAGRYSYAEYDKNDAKVADELGNDGTVWFCSAEELSTKSDHPDAQVSAGLWTKRQLTWLTERCARDSNAQFATSVEKEREVCGCLYGKIAETKTFIAMTTQDKTAFDKFVHGDPKLEACLPPS